MFNRVMKPGFDGKPRAWFRVSNLEAEDVATIFIYDEIGGFFGVDAAELVKDINNIRAAEILVRIHSPGGDAFDGFAIFNALKLSPAKVTVQIDHSAFSAASYIALAGDRVRMIENGLYMIHEPWTMALGSAGELRETADLLDKVTDQMVATYEKFSGLDGAAVRAALAAETFYTAEEALEAGFVDEVITLESEASAAMRGERRSPGGVGDDKIAARLPGRDGEIALDEKGRPKWEGRPGPADRPDPDKLSEAVARLQAKRLDLARKR